MTNMKMGDRHHRLTAAAIKDGWVEIRTNGPKYHSIINDGNGGYQVRWREGAYESQLFYFDDLDYARLSFELLVRGETPWHQRKPQ